MALRIKNGVMCLLLILVFLNLTTGCYYYKVNTINRPEPEDIRWEYFNNKYFIFHHRDSAWHMDDITVDTTQLSGFISSLPSNHNFYQRTDPVRSNRYYKNKFESIVLNEVHLYTSEPFSHEEENITVNFSSLQKMEIYYFDSKATTTSIVVPSVMIPVVIVATIGIIIALTKSSCPYVYVKDGDTFKFAGEIYSGSVYASLERNDYLPLPGFMPGDGKYTVKIANKLPEIQYINQAELWIVDHPVNSEVLADKFGVIHTLQSCRQPVAALSAGETDLAGLLSEKDDQFFLFNEEPSLTCDTLAKNSAELTFRVPAGQDSGKLVINARNSYWGDYIVGEFTKYFGYKYPEWIKKQSKVPPERPIGWKKDQSLPLMVYLETDEGWQFVDYFDMAGPLAFREMVMPVDLSRGLKKINDSLSQAKIKIETGFMFWELDYAAMDFTADVPVDLEMIGPSSAINESGKEVKKLITLDDQKYYTQPVTGNEVVIDYYSPPGKKELNRSVIFHTKGYYEHVRYYPNPPEREQLEAFRRPGRLSEFSFERFMDAKRNVTMKPSRDNK